MALGLLQPQEHIDMFLSEVGNRWGLATGSAFLVILSLWSLLAVFRRPREREVIIRESGLGRIQISAAALENLIRRAARDVRDVREVKPVLRFDQDGLVILLHMSVNPEANLPPGVTGCTGDRSGVPGEKGRCAGIQGTGYNTKCCLRYTTPG